MPIMLQLRPSKVSMCRVRPRNGGDDILEASLATLARRSSFAPGRRAGGGAGPGDGRGGRGGGESVGAESGPGTGENMDPESLAILASVQPLAKLSQLRYSKCKCGLVVTPYLLNLIFALV